MHCFVLLTGCICRFSQGLSARCKLLINGKVPDTAVLLNAVQTDSFAKHFLRRHDVAQVFHQKSWTCRVSVVVVHLYESPFT